MNYILSIQERLSTSVTYDRCVSFFSFALSTVFLIGLVAYFSHTFFLASMTDVTPTHKQSKTFKVADFDSV
ncbi:MAG: hypothetical protein K2Z81_27070 [Cyanobacteria bacterium]|nr:hypothetical protein [Cyanobacteriota bacterium]